MQNLQTKMENWEKNFQQLYNLNLKTPVEHNFKKSDHGFMLDIIVNKTEHIQVLETEEETIVYNNDGIRVDKTAQDVYHYLLILQMETDFITNAAVC